MTTLKKRTAILLLLIAVLLIPHGEATGYALLHAQEKIINNSRMIGVGGVNILDTYLSQEKYSGTELRYLSHTIREREGKKWSRIIEHQGDVAYTRNRADNGNEMALYARLDIPWQSS